MEKLYQFPPPPHHHHRCGNITTCLETKYKIQNTKHHHLDVAGLAILPPAPGGAEDARGQESDVSCLP